MKIIKLLSAVLVLLVLFSCSPDELITVKEESFMVKNMDPMEIPMIQVHKINGAIKTFSIYASNPKDSIVSFTATNANEDFVIDPVKFKMIDPAKPVTIDAEGKLSRKLSDVIFEYTVRIPNTFIEGEYSVTLNVTSGRGETKSVVVKLQTSSFLLGPNTRTFYNGQTISGVKNYPLNAASFLVSNITYTNVTDNSVTPPVVTRVPTAAALTATTVTTAISATNRPLVDGHIYTDLTDFDKRTMYLVSPNAAWIADSLRVLNTFKGTYPTAQMNDVKYVDLGEIDFNNLKLSDIADKQIGTAGSPMVKLLRGHGYGFLTRDGRVAVAYVKNIEFLWPLYGTGSPTAYIALKIQN